MIFCTSVGSATHLLRNFIAVARIATPKFSPYQNFNICLLARPHDPNFHEQVFFLSIHSSRKFEHPVLIILNVSKPKLWHKKQKDKKRLVMNLQNQPSVQFSWPSEGGLCLFLHLASLELYDEGGSALKGSLSPLKNENKLDEDFYCTLHKFVLIRFVQRNQGRRDSVMHEFHSNVNKVNKDVAKVRTIGDRLPLRWLTTENFKNTKRERWLYTKYKDVQNTKTLSQGGLLLK